MRHQSFLALDAEQQRLVRHYQPVSRQLAAYELDPRAWRTRFTRTVETALARVRQDPASGETARAKARLVAALEARRALTILQDVRDRARLIPLPEDSVS